MTTAKKDQKVHKVQKCVQTYIKKFLDDEHHFKKFLQIHPIYVASKSLLNFLLKYHKRKAFSNMEIFRIAIEFSSPPLDADYLRTIERKIRFVPPCLDFEWPSKSKTVKKEWKTQSDRTKFYSLRRSGSTIKRFWSAEQNSKDKRLSKTQKIACAIASIDREYIRSVNVQDLHILSKSSETAKDHAKSFTRLFEHSENLFRWVLTEILLPDKLSLRTKALDRTIRLCVHLKSKRDYHGFWMIMGGLHAYSISRLKKEWEKISSFRKNQFQELSQFMDPFGNYKRYRQAITQECDFYIPTIPILIRDSIYIRNSHYRKSTALNPLFIEAFADLYEPIYRTKFISSEDIDLSVYIDRFKTPKDLVTEKQANDLSHLYYPR